VNNMALGNNILGTEKRAWTYQEYVKEYNELQTENERLQAKMEWPDIYELASKHRRCLACGGYISKDEMIYIGCVHEKCCHCKKGSE